jgi:hypothetical protein
MEMPNRINEMEYSFDDSVNREIDMTDAEALFETSCNSEDAFARAARRLAAVKNEEVQKMLEGLEGNVVLSILRDVGQYFKLGENRNCLNDRRFRDHEGDDFMHVPEHREALDLLCDVSDFLSSKKQVSAIIDVADYYRHLKHLYHAERLLSHWLDQ